MQRIRHCELCQHEKLDFQKGVLCSLTNKKPSFKGRCSTIKLAGKLENKLKQKLISIKAIEKKKFSTYFHFTGYFLLGLIALGSIWYMSVMAFDSGSPTILPVAFLFIGFGLLGNSFRILFSYHKSTKQFIKEKEAIENMLIHYDLWYNVDFESSYTAHGLLEVEANLELYKV